MGLLALFEGDDDRWLALVVEVPFDCTSLESIYPSSILPDQIHDRREPEGACKGVDRVTERILRTEL